MSETFVVMASSETAMVDEKGEAQVSFSISNSNKKGGTPRIRIQPKADALTKIEWLSLVGESEQNLDPEQPIQVDVRVKIPESSPQGRYEFYLQIVGVENPDQLLAKSPSVALEFTNQEESKPPRIPVQMVEEEHAKVGSEPSKLSSDLREEFTKRGRTTYRFSLVFALVFLLIGLYNSWQGPNTRYKNRASLSEAHPELREVLNSVPIQLSNANSVSNLTLKESGVNYDFENQHWNYPRTEWFVFGIILTLLGSGLIYWLVASRKSWLFSMGIQDAQSEVKKASEACNELERRRDRIFSSIGMKYSAQTWDDIISDNSSARNEVRSLIAALLKCKDHLISEEGKLRMLKQEQIEASGPTQKERYEKLRSQISDKKDIVTSLKKEKEQLEEQSDTNACLLGKALISHPTVQSQSSQELKDLEGLQGEMEQIILEAEKLKVRIGEAKAFAENLEEADLSPRSEKK